MAGTVSRLEGTFGGEALAVECPACGAPPAYACHGANRRGPFVHVARLERALGLEPGEYATTITAQMPATRLLVSELGGVVIAGLVLAASAIVAGARRMVRR